MRVCVASECVLPVAVGPAVSLSTGLLPVPALHPVLARPAPPLPRRLLLVFIVLRQAGGGRGGEREDEIHRFIMRVAPTPRFRFHHRRL